MHEEIKIAKKIAKGCYQDELALGNIIVEAKRSFPQLNIKSKIVTTDKDYIQIAFNGHMLLDDLVKPLKTVITEKPDKTTGILGLMAEKLVGKATVIEKDFYYHVESYKEYRMKSFFYKTFWFRYILICCYAPEIDTFFIQRYDKQEIYAR